jgi:hypothetical protein
VVKLEKTYNNNLQDPGFAPWPGQKKNDHKMLLRHFVNALGAVFTTLATFISVFFLAVRPFQPSVKFVGNARNLSASPL